MVEKIIILLFFLSLSTQSYLKEELVYSDLTNQENLSNFPFFSFSEDLVEAKMGKESKQIINLLIGTPPQKIRVKLSTAICGLWILDKSVFGHGFEVLSSETYEKMNQEGKIDFTKGIIAKDMMNFCHVNSSDKIPFLLVQEFSDEAKIPKTFDGLIGLGYKCRSMSKTNVNVISYFINQNKNKRDIFTFKLNSATLKGRFFLGSISKEINVKSKLYRTIPVNQLNDNGHWEVNLHSVYFDDGTLMKVNSPLSIGIGGAALGVNSEVFAYFVFTYFKEAIEKGICKLEKNQVYEIFCDEDFDGNFIGTLSLVVGKWNIKISPSIMFKKVEGKNGKNKWFSIVYYEGHKGQFYLSQTMLEGINIVVYNKEENYLGIFQG